MRLIPNCMEVRVSNTLSLIAFYFAIISFVGSLFFSQVESWHGSVRSFQNSLSLFEARDEWKNVRPQWLGLKAAMPLWSFIVVGVLVTSLAVLSLYVPIERSAVDPWLFVYAPLWVTVLAYWLGGATRLWTGHARLKEAERKIDKGLGG